jgi:uncharacterized protein YciI
MFAAIITYIRPIEEIEARTAEHRVWLDQHVESGLLLLAGPMVPRTGGVLIFSGRETKDALAAILKQDPFAVHGLADYELIEFTPGKKNPLFNALV